MNIHAIRKRPFLATALVILCLGLSLAALAPDARGGVCEAALASCLIDAGLIMAQSPMLGLSYALFCMDGYTFCLYYY
jgi:hypothetical protein